MLKTLKYYLGIQALEADWNFYQKQWKQMDEQFCAINDHLVEIKDIIKSHDFNFCLLGKIKEMIDVHDEKALNHYHNTMGRLGMVLTEVGKVVPSQTVTSDYTVMSSLEGDPSVAPVSHKKRQEKIQQQITDCLRPHSKTGMHYLILAKSLARSKMEVTVALSHMVRKGIIRRLKPGVYALTHDIPSAFKKMSDDPSKVKGEK